MFAVSFYMSEPKTPKDAKKELHKYLVRLRNAHHGLKHFRDMLYSAENHIHHLRVLIDGIVNGNLDFSKVRGILKHVFKEEKQTEKEEKTIFHAVTEMYADICNVDATLSWYWGYKDDDALKDLEKMFLRVGGSLSHIHGTFVRWGMDLKYLVKHKGQFNGKNAFSLFPERLKELETKVHDLARTPDFLKKFDAKMALLERDLKEGEKKYAEMV
jgi:hypothetical protein